MPTIRGHKAHKSPARKTDDQLQWQTPEALPTRCLHKREGIPPLPKREAFAVEPTLTLDDFFFEFLSCKDLIWRTNHIQF